MFKNKRYLKIIVAFLLIVEATSIFLMYKSYSSKNTTLDEVGINNIDKSMFAIMLDNGDGTYSESTSSSWPTTGFIFNQTKSGCVDMNGNKLDGILSYDDRTNIATVDTVVTTYCYLYFDAGTSGKKISEDKKGTDGLSEDILGDMYRYQGTNAEVKNYICINADGHKCTSGDDDMYRIIGITPGGEIKVIKQTAVYGYLWNICMYDTNETGYEYCNGPVPEWPGSTMYNTLNTIFSTQISGILDKIQERKWHYGDITSPKISSKEMYEIETGSSSKEMNTTAKIGLMYLHDYGWASTPTKDGHDVSCYAILSGDEMCKTSWMHLSQNDKDASYTSEWTMSRYGSLGSSGYYSWFVRYDGSIYTASLIVNDLSIRPVFYLKSGLTIKLDGDGSEENPYIVG